MSDTSVFEPLGLPAILKAHERIRGLITRTPVLTSSTLDAQAGAELFFKCENLQKVGAFKARGAANAVCQLAPLSPKAVVTHSSGNHAAAVARTAQIFRIPAYVVMPRTAPKVKQAAVKRYSGNIVFCEPTQEAREARVQDVIRDTGGVLVHAYDDAHVIAGQGTVALELLEDVPDLDVILCPVGGGGLISGVAVAAKALKPAIRIIGVEPATADDAARSLTFGWLMRGKHPISIADGLLTSLCDRTYSEIRRHVDAIVTVSEAGIIASMRTIWEVMKLIVEPSGAVSYAAIAEARAEVRRKRVGVIVSGGNLDLEKLPWQ